MFLLNSKLSRWSERGIITSGQAEDIKAFEKERDGTTFFRGVFGIGIFAILIGIAAIVSANWHAIPAEAKLGGHFILYVGAIYSIYLSDRKGNETWRDVSLLAFFGLTLTFIGLVGQIYHLSGEIGDTLAMWMTLTTPAVLVYGRGHTIFMPWFAGLIVTYISSIDLYFDMHNSRAIILFGLFFALGCFHLSGSITYKQLEKLKNIFLYSGIAITLLFVSISAGLWYGNLHENEFYNQYRWVFFLSFFVFAISLFFLKLNHEDLKEKDEEYLKIIILSAVLISASHFIYPFKYDLLAAVLFILFWGIAGYCFQKMGWQRMVTLSLGLVGLRLYLVYLEVFGTLLETGIGLIVSGVLLLLAIYGVKKVNTLLKKQEVRS